VVAAGEGAALFTNDASCTVPKLPSTLAEALAFSTKNFNAGSLQGEDTGPTGAARTREGHVEVIEMGTVTNATRSTWNSIKDKLDGSHDCTQVLSAWAEGGYWRSDARTDIGPANGGLSGSATIVNVPLGTVQSYNADAVGQFYLDGSAGEHSAPEALTPNIASGTSLNAQVYPNDKPVNLTFSRGLDAVSAVFMVETFVNEYWTGGGTAASSEWVITYPTKRFYVDPYYVGGNAIAPFSEAFGSRVRGVSRMAVSVAPYDREGHGSVGINFPGPDPKNPLLSYETQVVPFRGQSIGVPSLVFASNLVPFDIPPQIGNSSNGWTFLDMYTPSASVATLADAIAGKKLKGQPVTGFWVTQLINGDVDKLGVLANYTALFRHKTRANCFSVVDGTPCS
ncbi:hypothetical protein, partial [Rudaea sp.]|uniref:hypothetical protein n=1 Tax=Rudaea sp. TaxID=2136325 RepID=UPI0032206987